jgi:succinyl-CoA synthetase beta subunit
VDIVAILAARRLLPAMALALAACAEQPWIKEIDINPLLATPERVIALDARIVLQDPGVTAELLAQLADRRRVLGRNSRTPELLGKHDTYN